MASELSKVSSDLGTKLGTEDIVLNESHIPSLLEELVAVSDKWQLLGIALGLPGNVISQCKHDNNVIALNNILHEWVSGNYEGKTPATLENLNLKLRSQTVARKLQINHEYFQLPLSCPAKRPHLMHCSDNISSVAKYLRKMYSRRREVPRNIWPVGTSTFINLVLVQQGDEISRTVDYSIRGDMDDIIKNKERMNYEDIFSKYIEGSLILVEGRPGSGKTTLLNKVVRDWSSEREILTDVKLVLLVALRVLDTEKSDHSLSDLLRSIFWDKSELESICRIIVEHDGKGICFILDGLDEYKQYQNTSSVVYALIHKLYLQDAMVIVTSRPVATADIRRDCFVTTYSEVIGFSKDQIYEYIDKYPFTNPNGSGMPPAESLKKYLEVHENILHMCYLPVHTTIVCFLHQYSGAVPHTETNIYGEFTRLILLRYLLCLNKKAKLPSLCHLPEKEKECFKKICQLAFEMSIKTKQVINEDDTDVSFTSDDDDFCGLGLVTVDHTMAGLGPTNTYTFLHLTLQYYLTALHITSLSADEQIQIFAHNGKGCMSDVLVFYCGMITFTGDDDARLDFVSTSDYSLRCAFESQQHVVCDSVVGIGGGIRKYGQFLTLVDILSMVYIIFKTSRDLQWLEIVKSHLNADRLKHLFGRSVNHSSLVLTSDLYGKLALLHHLDLSLNSLGMEGVVILVSTLNDANVHLRSLRLMGNNIGNKGVQVVMNDLKYCQDIEELDVRRNSIDGVAVWNRLESWTNLRDLYLGRNTIEVASLVEGIVKRSQKFSECNLITLQILDIDNCIMKSVEINELFDGLNVCTGLQELTLSGNIVCLEGMAKLCENLNWHELKTLIFADAGISTDGAKILAVGLKKCSALEKIDLSYNNIAGEGAIALAKSLKSGNVLNSIKLHDNVIGSVGAIALSKELKLCSQLKTLHLYGNDIDSEAQEQIMNMFSNIEPIL